MESLGATSRRSTDSVGPPPPPGGSADLQESAADAAEVGFLEDDNDLTAPLIHQAPPSPLGHGHIRAVRTAALPNAAAVEYHQTGNGLADVCTSNVAEAVYVLSEEHGTASFWQTVFNAVNILCGVGLLATPYAAATSGWVSLSLLVLTGAIACYTGQLLVSCMRERPGTATYPDIGWQAFGGVGKVVVAVLLYLELFCCCVDFIILQGDTLAAIFPTASLHWGPLALGAKQVMMTGAAIVILPTVWLRELSLMSILSLGGFSASVALLLLLAAQGLASPLPAAPLPVPLFSLAHLPISIGLYSFCFAGHAVFPSLYTSMRDKRRFGQVLVVAFVSAVFLYGSMAVVGVAMFGGGVNENVTLTMREQQPGSLPAQASMWLVVVSPATKFAMTMAPIAMALEELGPAAGSEGSCVLSMGVRTLLLLLVLGVALTVPFFALVMAFIGALLSMSVSVVAPCIFHLAICGARLSPWQVALNVGVAVLGVAAGGCSTYESVKRIVLSGT